MKEEIARYLRTYKLNEVEADTEDGIVPWDKCSYSTRMYWLKDAGQILSLIIKRGKEIKNPYRKILPSANATIRREVFNEAIQAFIKILEE